MSKSAWWMVGLAILLLAFAWGGSLSGPSGTLAQGKKAKAKEIEIVGRYHYECYNAEEDKTYSGPVEITKSGAYYRISYDDGAGEGVGIRDENTLAVSYTYKKKNGWSGGGLFVIKEGPKGTVLTGHYTVIPGNGKLGTDKWTPAKK